MPRFLMCTSCSRHVRGDERDCPFCGFGPLRCTAPPVRWAIGASLVLGLGGLAACDGKGSEPSPPAPAKTSATPADSGAAEGGAATADGGPRDQDDAAEPTPSEPDPPDIYGGPRMMSAGDDDVIGPPDEKPVADDQGDDAGDDDGGVGEDEAEPAVKPRPQPLKYGGPRRELDEPPKKIIE